ncbi:MAG: MBL fold metallo-hydrolase [Spirochaetaceae bacterium]|nr:MBL fold metallo-hydrolase [Spirochaetaceae bacterium]
MKLLSHFPAIGVSNTYIIGAADGGKAILVDPGRFDVTLLDLIENNNLDITTILITHDHENHVQGLRTLMKIYNPVIFAGNAEVLGFKANTVSGGMKIDSSGFLVEIIDVEGHSSDSRVYKVGHYIFTGDILSAGRIGSSPSSYSRDLLLQSIKTKIISLNEDLLILPGHGPPTTISAEIKWNPDFRIESQN